MKVFSVLFLGLAYFFLGAHGLSADSRDANEVESFGTCTGPSKSELSLSPENGNLEIEFEVEGRGGEVWNVVIQRRGRTIFNTNRRTGRTSRSFTAIVVNGPGTAGQVSAVATNQRTGERCTASATYA